VAAEYLEVIQGSPDWFEVRRGLPTASQFQRILAAGKGRQSYLWQLASERMTGEVTEGYSNADMERGNRMEPFIRRQYEMHRGVEVRKIGFIRNGKAGASTDGLVDSGFGGIVEFKSMEPHLLGPILDRPVCPNQFVAQVQGGLMVSERAYCDLMIYWHQQFPHVLIRVERDEEKIKELRNAVDVFDLELRRLVKRLEEGM
jgi:hypothetical protein